jgi:HK97 family phage prohead protease
VTEHRTLHGQVRAAGARTVTLRAITPGVVDDYGSVWNADAFDASLARRLPVLAWSHDWSEPIGVGISYTKGSGGPTITCRFDDFDAVPRARQAYAQVKSGTIRDCSVGFSQVQRRDPTDAEVAKWPGVREVIERARMDELSLVLAGAVPGAEVLAVRSAAAGTPGHGVRAGDSLDAAVREALAVVEARR